MCWACWPWAQMASWSRFSPAERERVKFCRGCHYLGEYGASACCDYILMTGHSRGCPPGEGCTCYDGVRKGTHSTFNRTPFKEQAVPWNTERAKELYEAGTRWDLVVQEIGRSKYTIWNYAKRHGWKRPEGWNEYPITWDAAKAREMYENGESIYKIADAVGMSIGAICNQVKNKGWKRKKPCKKGPPWDTEKAYRLWMGGMPLSAIAKELGINPHALQSYKTRHWDK